MRDVVGDRWPVAGFLVAVLVATTTPVNVRAQTRALDDFADVTGWKAAPSEGVTLAVSTETVEGRRAMRLDFDFRGHGGWAAVRKAVDLELSDNYQFTFRIRGDAPAENLEFKLADASGDDVWWSVRRDFAFPREWQTVRIKKRQISFAWGPAGGGELTRAAAIEIAITAGSGGKGSVWVSDLALTPLPPDHPYAGTPVATASSSLPGRSPAQALTGEGGGWHSEPSATGPQWLSIDFGERREIGGLVIDWDPAPRAFEVGTSDDGDAWVSVWQVPATQGGRSYVPIPDCDARFVRLRLTGMPPSGGGIGKVEVEPLAFAATPSDFVASLARDSRRGLYPRGFLGQMTSWTLVGVPDPTGPAGLLGADGAFEPAPRTFSIEPFVWLDGRLVTWADVAEAQSLLDGTVPIPTVRWSDATFTLDVTAVALDGVNRAALRYRLANLTRRQIAPRLYLAVRPLQVNPPSQFLSTPGGAGRVESIDRDGDSIAVDGASVVPLTEAWAFGATAFDSGDVVVSLVKGLLPAARHAADPGGRASAGVAYDLRLDPGASREVWVEVGEPRKPLPLAPEFHRRGSQELEHITGSWRGHLDRVEVLGPDEVGDLARTMKSNLAYILMSRDGPALRPGTRSYARSWIRDGAMMAAALLRLGHADEVRDYLRWYAPFAFADGRAPCCVDARGADPVPENDSNGELLFLAAEYLRYTGDEATVAAVWPHLARAVDGLDRLRQQRRTDAYRTPGTLAFFGLLPESISHEGYSAKPMHSYWDDFWALKGLADAAWLATKLAHPEEAARWSAIHDEFEHDLLASIARVREAKGLAYIPGCAELGDFDATSTTVALWPAGADAQLPRAAVEATFERYWSEAEARFTGKAAWDAYTPYEWRSVGAFVRLGWRERAVRLAGWLMADRMPIGWNQWPEVVHHDRTKAAFLGDLPHAWVGSDFIRSFLDMLAYERASDDALVLGAGVPTAWLAGDGICVRRLRTPHGPLSFTMRGEPGALRVRVESGVRVPPGGIVLRPPLPPGPHVATVNGAKALVSADGELIVWALPAEVVVRPHGDATTGGSARDEMER